MSYPVIKVENLSKRYKLGVVGYGTLRDDIKSIWAKFRGKEDPNAQLGKESRLGQHGEFWALRDINFEINQGDRVGIVGRNGAGKSTLLKVMSRITAPSEGSIKLKGRVASLLEVGTGFHPELTGRENVFLNGAILGMRRREILNKFEEIVDFAGVNEFIDTPVKRYSSGMYVRLAFSVAAHLDSDIMIIDEVLAVGDAAFQKKAIGKMDSASKNQGRTILFVSHSMPAITSLCNLGILMAEGRIRTSGEIFNVASLYRKEGLENDGTYKNNVEKNAVAYFSKIEILNHDIIQNEFSKKEKILVLTEFIVRSKIDKFCVVLELYNDQDICFYSSNTGDTNVNWLKNGIENGFYTCKTEIDPSFLIAGNYHMKIKLVTPGIITHDGNDISLDFVIVGNEDMLSTGEGKRNGIIVPSNEWVIG